VLISEAVREQIRAASDIVDVVGGYLPLKRAGAHFVALCPFHREKTPSFSVNPHLQIFYCFGCHKGGDVFKFLMEFEAIDFVEAVRRLAERARIPLEFERGAGEQQSRHLKEQLLQVHEQITQRWQTALTNEAGGQVARDYLATRGVGEEAVKLFRLGYAPDAWDDTVNWSRSKNYDLPLIEKAGLILKKEGTDRYYDRFRGRLIFPICDEQGRVVGFSGRLLSADAKAAKYVNSPETPIFIKSKIFYGLDKSKRALLESEYVVVCEGQLDLIACYMAGVQNLVAPQGTAFTAEHARILKRYVSEVVLCFDSDEAGQTAAVRALDHLLAAGLAVRVAVVPAPHDPDSFIRERGGTAFRELVEHAEGFFDYYLNRLCAGNEISTDKGRLAVLRAMAEAVQKTGNLVLIDKYAQKTALRLGVAPESVRREFAKSKAHIEAETEPAEMATPALAPPSPIEFWLLKLLLLDEDLVTWAAEHLDTGWIEHQAVREIVSRRLTARRDGTWTTLPAFLAQCGSAELENLVTAAVSEKRTLRNTAQQLADIALRLRNEALDRQIKALMQRAGQVQPSGQSQAELGSEFQRLKELKKQPI
jgi:DNA primase